MSWIYTGNEPAENDRAGECHRYTKLRMSISLPGQGILYMYSCVN